MASPPLPHYGWLASCILCHTCHWDLLLILRFSTSRQTLTWIPDSFFTSLMSGRIPSLKDETGAVSKPPTTATHIISLALTAQWYRESVSARPTHYLVVYIPWGQFLAMLTFTKGKFILYFHKINLQASMRTFDRFLQASMKWIWNVWTFDRFLLTVILSHLVLFWTTWEQEMWI